MRALDPVDRTAIRRWCAALGVDAAPYLDREPGIAPPAMLATWTMPGFATAAEEDDAVTERHVALERDGYTSVVATNCEQDYLRPLRVGERVSAERSLEAVSEEKQTALGPGVFVTTAAEVTGDGGEPVGRHRLRVLRYRPRARSPVAATEAEPPPPRPRPAMTRDTAFFWEGARDHRLLIQRCTGCGRLRHPPTAACARCGALDWDTVESAGRGELYSYTVVHAPASPAFPSPHVVALVALEEGTRLVSELVSVEPGDVRIGMPLRLEWLDCDPDLTLPVFRPADAPALLRIPLTRSRIVAAALATGDHQPMHHDPDVARAWGLRDVFANIHTTTGLVGRFAGDWAGPQAVLRTVSLRLAAPAYPGDTLELSGAVAGADGSRVTLAVRGRHARGDHVVAQVELEVPA